VATEKLSADTELLGKIGGVTPKHGDAPPVEFAHNLVRRRIKGMGQNQD
jgi:hypothetical protein